MAGAKLLQGDNLSPGALHQLRIVTSGSWTRSWGPLPVALAGGRDPGEPCSQVPGRGMPAGPPRLYHRKVFFLISRGCLGDEEASGDISGSAGHAAAPNKSAVKDLALHKRVAAAVEQAPAAAVAFPQPGEEQGGTGAEPAPTGHRGHRVPAAEWAAGAGGSLWSWGGKGTQCQHGNGTGEEGPHAGVAAPAPAFAPAPFWGSHPGCPCCHRYGEMG